MSDHKAEGIVSAFNCALDCFSITYPKSINFNFIRQREVSAAMNMLNEMVLKLQIIKYYCN
jgi:hypothetical protein